MDGQVMKQAPPVMILGCGRSGTSIFGELFEHITIYSYRSEPPFADVMSADYSLPSAFKVPRESDGFEADEGLSFPLAAMLRRAPEVKLFWIVRHPLDAICSLRVGIARNWGHHPRPTDWTDWLNRPLVEQCAHHWAFLNTVGFDRVSEIATVVTFENMVSDPEGFSHSICESLGIDPVTQQANLRDWQRRVQDTNNAEFIEAKTSRAYSRTDHSVRIGRWRKNLSKEDVVSVLPIVADAAALFGYSLPDARMW